MEASREPTSNPPRVGVFGGSFDPPHRGHLTVAQEVADHLGLDEVVWVPAHRSPHKPDAPLAPDDVRLAMVLDTAEEDVRFRVSTLELERRGPSFTVDTLRALREVEAPPGTELFLIMGVDQYRAFGTWRSPEEIRSLATLAVMDRGGDGLDEERGEAGVVRVPVSRIDISSTGVRDAVREGRPFESMVTAAVADRIRREGLYLGGEEAP